MKLLAVLLVQTLVADGPLRAPAWVMRSELPPANERACTDYSLMFWATSVKDGVPHAARAGAREHVDPLPFQIASGPDLAGNRWASQVSDGWIVGFDAGEFGGGLWWFNRTGTESHRIRPGATAPVNPADPYRAENVVGLPRVAGERLVLMGLDHLAGRSGRIFRLVRDRTDWVLAPLAVLDAGPGVWLVEGDRLLVLTESGLWSVEPAGGARRIFQTESGFLASTMVRAADGNLYVGLRHYVLRLEEANGKWRETWFTPAACMKVKMGRNGCECVG